MDYNLQSWLRYNSDIMWDAVNSVKIRQPFKIGQYFKGNSVWLSGNLGSELYWLAVWGTMTLLLFIYKSTESELKYSSPFPFHSPLSGSFCCYEWHSSCPYLSCFFFTILRNILPIPQYNAQHQGYKSYNCG